MRTPDMTQRKKNLRGERGLLDRLAPWLARRMRVTLSAIMLRAAVRKPAD